MIKEKKENETGTQEWKARGGGMKARKRGEEEGAEREYNAEDGSGKTDLGKV